MEIGVVRKDFLPFYEESTCKSIRERDSSRCGSKIRSSVNRKRNQQFERFSSRKADQTLRNFENFLEIFNKLRKKFTSSSRFAAEKICGGSGTLGFESRRRFYCGSKAHGTSTSSQVWTSLQPMWMVAWTVGRPCSPSQTVASIGRSMAARMPRSRLTGLGIS